MSPDWTSDETPERDKPHPHAASNSDLPIIDDDDDYEITDGDPAVCGSGIPD